MVGQGQSSDRHIYSMSLCSAGHLPSSATVFSSHTTPATSSSSSQPNSIFLSHHSSSSLQPQPAERSENLLVCPPLPASLAPKWTRVDQRVTVAARECKGALEGEGVRLPAPQRHMVGPTLSLLIPLLRSPSPGCSLSAFYRHSNFYCC